MGECVEGTFVDMWIEQERTDKTEPFKFPDGRRGFRK